MPTDNASKASAIESLKGVSLLKKEMPGLDALRGIAVLSVLFYHELYWNVVQSPPAHSIWARISSLFVFGWLGVFLFFVLSGFLITGILLDSKNRPNYWRNFYIRRSLRILPAFLLILIVLRTVFHSTWMYLLLCLGYMANLAQMFHVSGYLYGPLWSLAVEEQFYLGWPWMVKLLSRRNLAYAALAGVVLCPILRYLSAAAIIPLGDVHTMTWLISDNLAMGALMALLLRSRWGDSANVKRIAWSLLVAGGAVLAGGIPLGILHRGNLIGSAIQTLPFELMFAGLLLAALVAGDTRGMLSWTRPLRFFGYISYGLYLCHDLVFTVIDHFLQTHGFYKSWSARDWILRFLIEGTISVVLAWISRQYFEAFFLKMKSVLAPSS